MPQGFSEAPYMLPLDIRIVDDSGNSREVLDAVTNVNADALFDLGTNF